jgi:hypothetical protein
VPPAVEPAAAGQPVHPALRTARRTLDDSRPNRQPKATRAARSCLADQGMCADQDVRCGRTWQIQSCRRTDQPGPPTVRRASGVEDRRGKSDASGMAWSAPSASVRSIVHAASTTRLGTNSRRAAWARNTGTDLVRAGRQDSSTVRVNVSRNARHLRRRFPSISCRRNHATGATSGARMKKLIGRGQPGGGIL